MKKMLSSRQEPPVKKPVKVIVHRSHGLLSLRFENTIANRSSVSLQGNDEVMKVVQNYVQLVLGAADIEFETLE